MIRKNRRTRADVSGENELGEPTPTINEGRKKKTTHIFYQGHKCAIVYL